jgi:hypothetical protein
MDASVYSEAKGEYTKQLTLFIVPAFHKFFMDLLRQASEEEPNTKKQLWKFQEKLSQIPEWNLDKVQKEVSKLISDIPCDYLEELITAVFIAHTKVLTAIRIGNKNKRVQITIPKLEHFLHRALSESSRLLWSSAYLFHNDLSAIEKQKNHRQIEQLLHEGIAQAIRGLLPVKNILKDYITEPETDAETDDEGDEESEKPKVNEHFENPASMAVEENISEKSDTLGLLSLEKVAEKPAPPAIQEIQSEKIPAPESTPSEIAQSFPVAENSVVAPAPSSPPAEIDLPKTPPPTPNQEIQPVTDDIKPIPPIDLVESPKKSESSPMIIKVDERPQKLEPPTEVKTPTLIVATEPTVRFTDFDQVIQRRGETTHIDYVEKDRDLNNDEEFHFLDDEGDDLSDFEDLNDNENLNDSEFETI